MDLKVASKTDLTNWLKARGVKSATVNAMKLDTAEDRLESILKLHGLTLAGYRALVGPAKEDDGAVQG